MIAVYCVSDMKSDDRRVSRHIPPFLRFHEQTMIGYGFTRSLMARFPFVEERRQRNVERTSKNKQRPRIRLRSYIFIIIYFKCVQKDESVA